MILKFSLTITFLFGTIHAGPSKEDTRYSIENKWKSSLSECKPKPNWVEGVQKYYDDIIEAFNKFPGALAEQADLVKIPFEAYLTKLVNNSNSNSTVLSSGSSAILGVLSKVKLQANTPDGVVKEFYRVLPILTKTYREVISNLSKIIGEKASCAVNDAMTDLEREYTKYMTEFLQDDENGLKKELDYEPITKRADKFKKAVALVAEANKCGNPETQDASTVLTLILDHLIICYYGLKGCVEAILYEQNCKQPGACCKS